MDTLITLLNKYVESSEYTKNTIITLCKINRSTFFQYLSGKRKPSIEFLERLVQVLQLTPGQEKELWRRYKIAQIGEQLYSRRKQVERCISTVAELSSHPVAQIMRSGTINMEQRQQVVRGKDQIGQVLMERVEAEFLKQNPHVDFFLPLEYELFFHQLHYLYSSSVGRTVQLRQLIQFPQNAEQKTADVLRWFQNNIRFLSCDQIGYEMYYYYADARLEDMLGVAYPYYMITSDCVVLIDVVEQQAVVWGKEIVSTYTARFQRVIERARPFHNSYAGFDKYIEGMMNVWRPSSVGYLYFSQPCFSIYLTDDLVKRYAPPEIEELAVFYCKMAQQVKSLTSFCSIDGLQAFADNGIFLEWPKGMIPPIEPEDRRYFLRSVRDNLGKCVFIIDENKLPMLYDYIIEIEAGGTLCYSTKNPKGLLQYNLVEQNLTAAFEDFFQSLIDSDYLLSPEESIAVLERIIDGCH